MKVEEFDERGLKVNRYGKILDEYGNEYRNEEGCIEYLEIPDKVLGQILAEDSQNKGERKMIICKECKKNFKNEKDFQNQEKHACIKKAMSLSSKELREKINHGDSQ